MLNFKGVKIEKYSYYEEMNFTTAFSVAHHSETAKPDGNFS
jgi:hypothetical protein